MTEVKSKFVTLAEWAKMMFSKPPHPQTLLRWVHEGRIQPQPKKLGKYWHVARIAEYVGD